MHDDIPKISFIIPVFNEEKNINECLGNLSRQNYPKDRIEIFIVDGGSTDKTTEIAKKYNCILLHNPRRTAPSGKALALTQATGDYVYFHEADVLFSSPEWINDMIRPLLKESDIFGTECDWGIADDFNSFNTYCTLLKIADPLARILSKRKPIQTTQKNGYYVEEYLPSDNPIMYCFLWRKNIIDEIGNWHGEFAEANYFSKILSSGHTKFAHQTKSTAFHYYADSLLDFTKKRRKIAQQFLNRSKSQKSWANKRSFTFLLFSALYLVTFIGPLLEAIYEYIRSHKKEWFWHPLASFLTILIYSLYFIKLKIWKTPN